MTTQKRFAPGARTIQLLPSISSSSPPALTYLKQTSSIAVVCRMKRMLLLGRRELGGGARRVRVGEEEAEMRGGRREDKTTRKGYNDRIMIA